MFILSILFSLAITLCVETYIYLLLKWRSLKLLIVVSLANLILNPLMNTILYYFADNQYTYWLILSIYEVGTVFIESSIIFLTMRFKYFKILLIAFIANLASFLIGLALSPVYENYVITIVLTVLFLLGYLFIYFLTIGFYLQKQKDNP